MAKGKVFQQKNADRNFQVPGSNIDLANAVIRNSSREHVEVACAQIRPNPHQPRKTFTDQDLRALADSINEEGLIEEVILRYSPTEENALEIVCGERRWRACYHLLGWTHIPAEIRECTDEEMLTISLIENDQRVQLSPLELAQGYQRLYAQTDDQGNRIHTIRSLAARLGKDKDHIQMHLNLLRVPDDARQLLQDDPTIPVRIINELGDVPSPADRALLIEQVRARTWKTDDVIAIVRSLKKQHAPGAPSVLPGQDGKEGTPVVTLPAQAEPEQDRMGEGRRTSPREEGQDAPSQGVFPAKSTTVPEHERIIRPSPEFLLATRLRQLARDEMHLEKVAKRYTDEGPAMTEGEKEAVREHVQRWIQVLASLLQRL